MSIRSVSVLVGPSVPTAELSGVSRATVSRVINGGSVASATRERVLQVMAETNYRPNLAARSLASGRSGIVGLALHVPAPLLFGDPYFSLLMQGLTDALASEAVGVMLWLGNLSKEETPDRVASIGILDSVIVTATDLEDPLMDGLLASERPIVLIGHRRHDATASYVDVDNISAARSVVEHLLGLGRRRIGHITGARGTVAGDDRLGGYLAALDGAGIAERFVVDGDFNEDTGHAAMVELLGMGVDAVLAENDISARGALRAIRKAGLRVPDQVAVAGFDDLEFAPRLILR